MLYRELTPPAALRPHVVCVWVLDHAAEPGAPPEKILPDGHPELIFNLGAPYRRLDQPAGTRQPRSFVVGQIRRYLEVVPTGHVSCLGVRLQSTALHRLLGESMGGFTDRSVSLDDLGHGVLLALEARLHDASSWSERVALVHEALVGLLGPARTHAGEAMALIRRHHGTLELTRVAERIGMSARTLDRRFAVEVGLTPKLFARQVRLQRVFELLSRSPRPSWSVIARASGCYDQAHLNREFRAFSGESPAAFLQGYHGLSDHLTGLQSASTDPV